jgi:hypothetical protein
MWLVWIVFRLVANTGLCVIMARTLTPAIFWRQPVLFPTYMLILAISFVLNYIWFYKMTRGLIKAVTGHKKPAGDKAAAAAPAAAQQTAAPASGKGKAKASPAAAAAPAAAGSGSLWTTEGDLDDVTSPTTGAASYSDLGSMHIGAASTAAAAARRGSGAGNTAASLAAREVQGSPLAAGNSGASAGGEDDGEGSDSGASGSGASCGREQGAQCSRPVGVGRSHLVDRVHGWRGMHGRTWQYVGVKCARIGSPHGRHVCVAAAGGDRTAASTAGAASRPQP